VLIDYGQAVLIDAPGRASSAVVGTPGFIAPEEILEGRSAVSPAVDVYGLAAVGYALLTGRPPALGDDVLSTLSEALREPPRPRDLGVAVPEALEAVLLEGLAADPAARPDAAAFASALEFVGVQVGLGSG
jgi:serine/threonine protein kinase